MPRLTVKDSTFILTPVASSPAFASKVERTGDKFTFRDETGHNHGEYEIGNAYSPAPDGAIGATWRRGEWFWITPRKS